MNNLVAIVGRPNVGKSSLFNMIIGKRKAIVDSHPGITRDRLYANAKWSGKNFKIIDTGGIEIANRPFQEQIKIQAQIAIEEATVIIFVVDGLSTLTNDDQLVIKLLRRTNKPILVAANKLEGNKKFDSQIYATGFKSIFPISAIHGDGVGDLIDQVLTFLNFNSKQEHKTEKLAIIGCPNVGKSSLLNMLADKERSIVSPISGTTRDAVDTKVMINNQEFIIIDTAGIRRKSRLVATVDHYALVRAMNAITEANIVLLMIDSQQELTHFDLVIGGYAYKKFRPIIIIANKWDLVDKKTVKMEQKRKAIEKAYKFLSWAPIVFISAKTGSRFNTLKTKIIEVSKNKTKSIKTGVLNDVINEIQIFQPAQSFGGGKFKVKFAKQIESDIPKFLLWTNNKKYLHFSYQRFLENKLRDYFGFEGTPIKFIFKDTKNHYYER